MNAKTKIGLEIVEAALLLGLLGDALLRATPWGLNVLLWTGALMFAMAALTLRRKRELWSRETMALHGAVIIFAAFVAWRDSMTLQILDVLIVLAILAILSLSALKVQVHLTTFSHYVLAAVNSSLNAAAAPILLILNDIEWKTIPSNGWSKHAVAVLRGLAIAAPILLIFGALFMAADAVFENIVNHTLNIKPEIIFGHVLLFSFLTWICCGYLRGVLFGSLLSENPSKTNLDLSINQTTKGVVHDSAEIKEQSTEQGLSNWLMPNFLRLGAVEIGIVLSLINLLFLSFVAVQIRYFFGGMDFIQATENFKLAEYARRGFFELCWVAALVLPILLTTHFLLKKDNPVTEKIFRGLAGINIGLLFVIMYSAVNRMLLYTGSLGYGLTEMRFYPTAFMFWLALIFVWFGLTVLRGHAKHFAWGALWAALFVVAGLHVLNPDNFIVRHNVKLMEQGRSFDARYNSNLSDDAVPFLAAAVSDMSNENRHVVQCEILRRTKEKEFVGVLNWNWSRQIAQMEMSGYSSSWDGLNCFNVRQQSYDDF